MTKIDIDTTSLFMPEVLAKTKALRARGYEGHVEMDGGFHR